MGLEKNAVPSFDTTKDILTRPCRKHMSTLNMRIVLKPLWHTLLLNYKKMLTLNLTLVRAFVQTDIVYALETVR